MSISSAQVLPHEETLELIELAKSGDEEAFDTLVRHNIALVKSIIKKYADRGIEYDDLFQIGCMGLVKAVKNYDASFNVRFSTYAVPMIVGEVKRSLRDDGMIKVSRSMKELGVKAMAAQEKLSGELNRDATIDEIADFLGCTPYDVAESLEAMRPHVSIYEPVYDESDSGVSIADRIVGDNDTEERVINNVFLKEVLDSLDPRDRQVIVMRYYKNMTQSQIASVLGISQVQVSRLESKILARLREKYKGACG